MPYIKPNDRASLREPLDVLLEVLDTTNPGELNYVISTIMAEAIKYDMRVSYAKVNELIGVLECAKLELYRRIAAPYEDKKCSEHGDVF